MDRYGNQFARRVESRIDPTFAADVVQEAGSGCFRLMIGGVILSPVYMSMDDATDAADVILVRLVEGSLLVEPMPDGPEDQQPDYTMDDDRGAYEGGEYWGLL